MKTHAIGGRDEPKDVYDLCYCLDEYPDAIAVVAADWRARREDPLVAASVEILREKFQTVDHYGPQQLAVFHDAVDVDERAMNARRAFELVQKLLRQPRGLRHNETRCGRTQRSGPEPTTMTSRKTA